MRRIPAAVGWTALVLMLVGCAGFGKVLDTPEVSLVDIRVREMRALEAAFEVQLRVLNPNDVALELTGLDCRIELNGKRFARGVVPVDSRVAPYGTVVVPMQVYASVLDMAGTVFDMIQGARRGGGPQPVHYKVSGRLGVRAGRWPTPSLSFSDEGKIDLQGLAAK